MRLVTLLFLVGSFHSLLSETHVDVAGKNFQLYHEINSLAIGVALALMTLICFFSFVFKVFGFHYLPEPSVCLICGMLLGAIIRFRGRPINDHQKLAYCVSNETNKMVPGKLIHTVGQKSFEYHFEGQYHPGASQDDILATKILFDSELFFYLILPPIIFNMGFRLKKKYFFRNFGAVLTMALVATGITMLLFSSLMFLYSRIDKTVKAMGFGFLQSLIFGVIVCSTDPVSVLTVFTQLGVDNDLFSIILGESALNDAVSLIAQRSVNDYLMRASKNDFIHGASSIFKSFGLFIVMLVGSFAVGTCVAVINALLTKAAGLHRCPTIEAALFIILSYCSFLLTEMCGMVGIVGVLFCGIFQAHYTQLNLSDESRLFVDKIATLLCFFFENFVFAYMGITVFVFSHHVWNVGFIVWSFVSLMLSRAAAVYFLCYILNRLRRRKIKMAYQHIMFFAGLKGAISFALAFEDISTDIRRLMLTSTIILVLITVLIFGGSIAKLISFLGLPVSSDASSNTNEHEEFDITYLHSDNNWMVRCWYNVDNNFLTPFLTTQGPPLKDIFKRLFKRIFCSWSAEQRLAAEPIMKVTIKPTTGLSGQSFISMPKEEGPNSLLLDFEKFNNDFPQY